MLFLRRFWLLMLGVLLFVSGVVAVATFPWPVATFGWTAYAPLTSSTFTPSWAPYAGILQLGVGAVLIAGWIGFQLGRRGLARRDVRRVEG